MTDYMKEAEVIYQEYRERTRRYPISFNDAVIGLLFLIARLMIARYERETPSVVPEKKGKK